jgi:hypothetical protein
MKMKTEEQAAMIYTAIIQCFSEDNELGFHIKTADVEANFFEAGVLALQMLYQRLTGNEQDIIDFIGVLNKVVIQGLLEKQEVSAHDR